MNKENILKIPPNPMISNSTYHHVGYRDTLDRAAAVLSLLSELDLSKGLSPSSENGLFWVQLMVIDSLRYVSKELAPNEEEKLG